MILKQRASGYVQMRYFRMIVIFRPQKRGRKIIIYIAFFLQILPNLHFLLHFRYNLLVLINRPTICLSTLYPNF